MYMADFTEDLRSFRASYPYFDIDPSMEPISNIGVLDNSNLNYQSFIPFSNINGNFSSSGQPALEFPGCLVESFPGIFHPSNQSTVPVAQSSVRTENESKKRKAIDVSGSSCENSSPGSENGPTKRKNINNLGRRKRVKNNEKDDDQKPKEVVHVRARRGQATDSHSLAERVRRGKINERLRCLQDIVPGCCKTMGMAVMLDEIINYVQSLQNQIEFLSMKLTAASTFYDFNSESDAIETMQRAKALEPKEMERLTKREGYGGIGCSQLITRPL